MALVGRPHDLYFGVEKGIGHDLLADYDGVAGEYDLVVELDIVASRGLSLAAVEDILLGEGGLEFFVHLINRAGLDLEIILSLPLLNLHVLLVALDCPLEQFGHAVVSELAPVHAHPQGIELHVESFLRLLRRFGQVYRFLYCVLALGAIAMRLHGLGKDRVLEFPLAALDEPLQVDLFFAHIRVSL